MCAWPIVHYRGGGYAHADCHDARWALADVRTTMPDVQSYEMSRPKRDRCKWCHLPMRDASPAEGWNR